MEQHSQANEPRPDPGFSQLLEDSGKAPAPKGSISRAAELPGEQPLTGPQRALARFEESLPAALKKRAVAAAFLVVMLLAAVFGLGGAKLTAWQRETESLYLNGDGSSYDTGIVDELSAAVSAAQSITDLCAAQLGEEDAGVAAARAAIEQCRSVTGGPASACEANEALQSAVSYLYNAVRHGMDGTAGQALQGQWSDFTAHQDIMARSGYNWAAEEYNRVLGGFPANLIGALWGAEELERFG